MNQRKLIGALSILLLAILFITVGCGDGKRNGRTNLNKRLTHGKTGAQLPKPDSPEFKAKKQAMEQAKAQFEASVQGERLSSLPEGDYSLSEIITFVDYIHSTAGEDFKYLRHISLSESGAVRGQQFGDGVVRKSPDAQGREIFLPSSLSVAGAVLTPDPRSNGVFKTRVVDASMDAKGSVRMTLDVDFANAATQSGESLVSMLNQNKATFSVTGGKATDLFILKQSGDKIAIQLAINEGAQPGQQNNLSKQAAVSFARKIVFVYGFKAKQQAAPPPATQQQQQQQQPDQGAQEQSEQAPAGEPGVTPTAE